MFVLVWTIERIELARERFISEGIWQVLCTGFCIDLRFPLSEGLPPMPGSYITIKIGQIISSTINYDRVCKYSVWLE